MVARKKAAEKPTGEGRTLALPEIDFRVALVRVKGISPLITHAWSEKAKTMMRDKQTKMARMARSAKDPEAEYNAARYIDKDGDDCVPSAGFRNAMISAGRFADGVPMTIIRGAVFVVGETVKIRAEKPRMREDMVRVGGKGPGTGVADLRYRPEYDPWECDLRIQYNAHVLTIGQVLNLVRLAGLSIGLCEWRPEKGGQFGRFDIVGEAQELRGDAANT